VRYRTGRGREAVVYAVQSYVLTEPRGNTGYSVFNLYFCGAQRTDDELFSFDNWMIPVILAGSMPGTDYNANDGVKYSTTRKADGETFVRRRGVVYTLHLPKKQQRSRLLISHSPFHARSATKLAQPFISRSDPVICNLINT
jgi:hypothetical protein